MSKILFSLKQILLLQQNPNVCQVSERTITYTDAFKIGLKPITKIGDKQAAKDLFKKALQSNHVSKPRVITVDKNPTYPIAIEQLKREKSIPDGMQIR